MSVFLTQTVSRCFVVLACVCLNSIAFAQGIPDRNVNIIGVSPTSDGIPDFGLKQQNEGFCGEKPTNPLQILCVFNDYRGVDIPIIGDAWEGYAYSINGGQTWFSDLLPGHPGDSPNIGLAFAADPSVSVAPGLALVSYIAADRGDNADSGLFLHRLFELNREAGAPWAPEMMPNQISDGNRNKFIDKPSQLLHLAPPGSGTVLVSSTLKDGTEVSQAVPAGRLFIAYTTFKNNKSELTVAQSDDYGESWKRKKISQGNGLNQSTSIAAHGDNVCVVWRRFEKKKFNDAIMTSCSTDRGKKWSKPAELSAEPEFFPFDQATTENTFRTNSYPSIVSDGSRFYAFWSSRIDTASPFFARIVYTVSTDGSSWSAPAMVEDALNGHQFMPTAAAAEGVVQLAWYDTRNDLFQGVAIQDVLDPSESPPTKVIRKLGDMRTVQLVDGIVTTPSTQVSRYVEGVRVGDSGPPRQLEYNFLNDRLFQMGAVPFISDYPNVSAPQFRLEGGSWVANNGRGLTERPVDFLVSWTDNRDVRGNVWGNLSDPTIYTPADQVVEGPAVKLGPQDADADQVKTRLAALENGSGTDADGDAERSANLNSAGEVRADAVPDLPGTYGQCIPDGRQRDRTRNQNVYSSVVRPGVSIESPSASKPTGSVQRAHVVWVSNNTNSDVTYTLTIDEQPPDAPVTGRASFVQVPVAPYASADGLLTSIDVDIDPDSTVARTVFITSLEPNPPIAVSVSDGTAVLGTITVNPDVLTPDIQNPDIQNPDIQNPDIQNAEVHNPDIQNPVITTVQNPDVQNPDIQNPDIQNPDIQNPDIQNADYQNPDIQNPDIQNPDIQNAPLEASGTENPDLANDTLTPGERQAGYTDVTWEVQNDGNTTTAFNLDAFIAGDTSGYSTQLIATRTQLTQTARNCVQAKQAQNLVIFNLIDPDLTLFEENTSAGIFGDGSAYIAPGETILLTLRVWGDVNFEPARAGVRVEAQSCNSEDKGPGTTECDPPFEQIGSPDAPPIINVPDSPYHVEAGIVGDDIGGVTDILVTVTDDFDASVLLSCDAGILFEEVGLDEVIIEEFIEIGETVVVNCSATDSAGNTTEESFVIEVSDTQPPQIQIGDGGTDFFVYVDDLDSYFVYYLGELIDVDTQIYAPLWVQVFDSVDPSPSLSCEPGSGGDQTEFLPPVGGVGGVTEVVCEASDYSGNLSQSSFEVIVIENQ